MATKTATTTLDWITNVATRLRENGNEKYKEQDTSRADLLDYINEWPGDDKTKQLVANLLVTYQFDKAFRDEYYNARDRRIKRFRSS